MTVSAVPDEDSPEVGGLQNTMTNLGASLGTALAGSLLIATVAPPSWPTSSRAGDPDRVKSQAQVELSGGVPFISDADLEAGLDDVSSSTTEAALDAYREARIDGHRSALAILAALAIGALFLTQRIPAAQPRAAPT